MNTRKRKKRNRQQIIQRVEKLECKAGDTVVLYYDPSTDLDTVQLKVDCIAKAFSRKGAHVLAVPQHDKLEVCCSSDVLSEYISRLQNMLETIKDTGVK